MLLLLLQTKNSMSISIQKKDKFLVGTIQIVDPDPEAIAPCHYVCNNENSESAFHICPKTGRITVKNKSKVNFWKKTNCSISQLLPMMKYRKFNTFKSYCR